MIHLFSLKSFVSRLKGQAGMSVAEMAITMGLVGLGALGAASLSGNMSTGSKKIQGMVSVNTFASSLNAYLYSNPGCADIKAVGNMSATPSEIALTKWEYQGITRFEGGLTANNEKKTPTKNFFIESLAAYYEFDNAMTTVADADGDLTKAILKIKARLVVGKKPQEFVFNVPVLVQGMAVKYCSDEKNLAETCAAAQGKYNASTKECELGNACKIKGTWSELTCRSDKSSRPACSPIFGSGGVNQFTGGLSCPTGSTETITQTENWTSKRDCGKKCTETIRNTMKWAVCLECP